MIVVIDIVDIYCS